MTIDFYLILGDLIKKHLNSNCINTELSANIAKTIINDVVDRFGGQSIYLKNNSQVRLAEKHKQILAEFDGSNHRELCRKYQIGATWLKKLLAREAKNELVN